MSVFHMQRKITEIQGFIVAYEGYAFVKRSISTGEWGVDKKITFSTIWDNRKETKFTHIGY